MNEFTASNGYTITNSDEDLVVRSEHGTKWVGGGLIADAIREYVEHRLANARAEEDERLGRWRWPENPDYVLYDNEDEGVWVLCEREPGAIRYQSRDDIPHAWASNEAGYVAAARAYFDAHPEPKPWHDAKPDDVWILTIDGEEVPALIDGDREFHHRSHHRFRSVLDESITAGRRIYPEVS